VVLINSQGYIDGIGFGSKAPRFVSELGLRVLKSDQLRRAATKVGFHNKALATEDAFRAGRVHIFNEGWMDAKVAYIKSNGYNVNVDKV
jgi:hypothetical protein